MVVRKRFLRKSESESNTSKVRVQGAKTVLMVVGNILKHCPRYEWLNGWL